MSKTIVPACLEYADGVPYSSRYGDIYHSADGGAGQARHVFLQGCGLPGAWAGRECFSILETGFGTGLNFLMTWAAWRTDPRRSQRLHFVSVEKHPFTAEDLARLHRAWPELASLSQELLASWPMLTPGFHRIALDDGGVQLTLMLGGAAECLPQLQAGIDAFYLDGFAPDRNADLWQASLYRELARLAKPGARVATYTVAASVREGLTAAGFMCEKRPGYGRKRHCLSARFDAGVAASPPLPQHVAVIGAGVAGSATAHALARRGIRVTLLEREGAPAQGASGNPLAVFRPMISDDDNRASRLIRAAFLHDLRAWQALGSAVEWSNCGVLHLAKTDKHADKMKQALASNAPPPEYARWVEVNEAGELANWPVAQPGVFYPQGGWAVPASLCRAWLDHPRIEVHCGCAAVRLEQSGHGWRVLDDHGMEWVEADAVVLANARDAMQLFPGAHWAMQAVRGQISRLPSGTLPEIRRVITREGYVAPGVDGRPVVGASYDYDDDPQPRTSSDEANLLRLEHILPGASGRVAVEAMTGRASFRAVTPDRLPHLGAVKDAANLYIASGYASRGVVWAGLLGETLAGMVCDEPLPLERDLLGAIDPSRFGV